MAEVDDRVGNLVDGRYRILEAMASGSMGAVYKAERVPVGKLVAVKFLHASYANDTEFLARFERETRVMSKLAHPNCVSVVDFGVWEGNPYLVMEYVGGRTLRKIIDQGPLPASRALSFARQITAGLAHAHAQGITHRDVKPANIMVSEEIGAGEHVRILDFGLARLRGTAGRDATQSNVVVGTPNYMAPEQTVGGGTIDARTDIYAVGVVLFEMIAGERPFQAEDTMALLGMHRAAPVPRLSDRAPEGVEIPDGLEEIVERALAKSPDDRFPSAIAMAKALDALAGRPSQPTDMRGLPIVSRQADTLAIAPTLLDVDSRSAVATVVDTGRASGRLGRPVRPATTAPMSKPERSSSTRAGVFLALVVLGGGAYAAYYVQSREAKGKSGSAALAQGSGEAGSADRAGPGEPPTPEPAGSAAEPAAGSAEAVALGSAATPEPAGAGSADPAAGSADPAVGSAGSAALGVEGEELVPAPDKATNPDPAGAGSADDEDDDAPKTQADIEARPKLATPALATTIDGAVKLIQEGKRDLAVASLQALQKKQTRNPYIPFLLGNLYYDRRWWSVSMDHYRAAIQLAGGYRANATLIRNVIRMLISKKTDKQAETFLRRTIGRSALPYLQSTARSDPNAYMRRYAAALARAIR